MESALHGLRVFIGRLESYYDVIISELNSKSDALEEQVSDLMIDKDQLQAENKRLKAELQAVSSKKIIWTQNDVVKDLQAEAIEQIKDNKRLQDKLQEVNNDYNNDTKVHNEYADGLLAEIKQLKADINHDAKVCYDVDDKHIEIIKELEAEIKELKADNNKHYPKEYQAEASEYFHHNPQADKVMFYMLDNNEACIDYDALEQYEIACINNAEDLSVGGGIPTSPDGNSFITARCEDIDNL